MNKSDDKIKIVGMPIYDRVTLLDFAGATQVFAFAPGFKPVWIAETMDAVTTSENVSVLPHYDCNTTPDIDILFIPGGEGEAIAKAMQPDNAIQQFVKKTSETASWSGAVCTGAFIAAAAGILREGAATTYWSVLDQLARFPNLQVAQNKYPRFEVCDKQHHFSGGGVSSSLDLALELVRVINNQADAEMADLAIQYAPDPPVNTGSPATASKELQNLLIQRQQKKFIGPITEAVTEYLHRGTS